MLVKKKGGGTCKSTNYFWFQIPLTTPFKGIILSYFDDAVGPCPCH